MSKESCVVPILLLLSSVSYGIAFLFPDSLWWMIFFYPLFLLLIPKAIGFCEAFFWSFIAHGLHLTGIALALYRMNTPLFIVIGMFFYVPFVTGCIFAVTKKLSLSIIKQPTHGTPTIINSISLLLHRFFVTHIILLPFGRLEGYIFMHPLILLVDILPFRSSIQWYNLDLLTFIFYGISISMALFLREKTAKYLVVGGICIALIIFPTQFEQRNVPVPSWIHSIAVISLFFPNPRNLTAIGTIMKQKMENTQNIKLFVLPEGAINCPLSCTQVEKIFRTDNMYNVIVCSPTFKNQKLRNGCFFLQKNACHTVYYKRHALPATERPIFHQVLDTFISPSKNAHPVLTIDEAFSLVPYICSDFFFNNRQDDIFHRIPILALCNDLWFSGFASYIQQLMAKTAQIKALNWNRPIVYVSYSKSYYIDTNGAKTALVQVR